MFFFFSNFRHEEADEPSPSSLPSPSPSSLSSPLPSSLSSSSPSSTSPGSNSHTQSGLSSGAIGGIAAAAAIIALSCAVTVFLWFRRRTSRFRRDTPPVESLGASIQNLPGPSAQQLTSENNMFTRSAIPSSAQPVWSPPVQVTGQLLIQRASNGAETLLPNYNQVLAMSQPGEPRRGPPGLNDEQRGDNEGER